MSIIKIPSLIVSPSGARFHRATTERTPRELRETAKTEKVRFLKILTKSPFVFKNTMGDFFVQYLAYIKRRSHRGKKNIERSLSTAYPPLIHPIKTQQILPKSKLFAHLLANVRAAPSHSTAGLYLRTPPAYGSILISQFEVHPKS